MKNDVVKVVRPFIEEIVTSNNLHLFDLEFVKEDGMWFLRVSIEKDDGTHIEVGINENREITFLHLWVHSTA